VAQTHGKILAAADRMFRYEAGGSAAATQGATLAFLPLYHNLGLYHNFVLNLRAGSKTLVHAAAPSMPLTLGLLLEAAPALKPTSLEVVAVLAEQLAQLLAVGGELGNDIKQRLASLDSVKVGGSPLSAEAHVSLTNAGLAVLQHYGQTELCGYVLASAPRKRGAPPPVGRANALHKVDAAVAYDLRGGGAVGELVLAGLQDEPYATGDIFRRGDDGSLTFHARVDGMLVLGSGEMVDPAPLERALLAKLAGDVVRCCLVGDGRPRPALLLELRSSARGGDGLPTEDALLGVEAALADVQADAPAATRILDTHVLVLDEPLPVTLKGAVDVTAAMDRKKTVLKQADDGVLLDDSLAALKRVCYANE
jgi:acyl-coenzyme A synthetase/AMP-(fatty) acid ligase